MKYLFILNDSPYGIERTHNGLRLASSLSKQEGETVSVFLMGDAAACSVRGQNTPNGYYNLERMLKFLASKGCTIGSAAPAWMLAESALNCSRKVHGAVQWMS
jgi:uncharacterized protein involved in oxidation of intracellular sulfur